MQEANVLRHARTLESDKHLGTTVYEQNFLVLVDKVGDFVKLRRDDRSFRLVGLLSVPWVLKDDGLRLLFQFFWEREYWFNVHVFYFMHSLVYGCVSSASVQVAVQCLEHVRPVELGSVASHHKAWGAVPALSGL